MFSPEGSHFTFIRENVGNVCMYVAHSALYLIWILAQTTNLFGMRQSFKFTRLKFLFKKSLSYCCHFWAHFFTCWCFTKSSNRSVTLKLFSSKKLSWYIFKFMEWIYIFLTRNFGNILMLVWPYDQNWSLSYKILGVYLISKDVKSSVWLLDGNTLYILKQSSETR